VEQFQNYLDLIEEGKLVIDTGPIVEFENLIQAHELMDANQAGGKIVVLGKQ
jgi:D-arabinose 1-dehydrogenase-like Zn-dependent alcohol dehydrogenase